MKNLLLASIATAFFALSLSAAEDEEAAPKSSTMQLPPWTVTAQRFQALTSPGGEPTVTRIFGKISVSAEIDGVVTEAKAGRAVFDHRSRMLTLYFNAIVTRGEDRVVATDPKTQIILHPGGKMDVLGPSRTETVEAEP